MLTATYPKDPLVNMIYVQSQFNRSSRTIYDWIKAGIIPPPMTINGYNAWRQSEIDKVLENFSQSRTD